MNRVGQVWEFYPDYVAVIVQSREHDTGWVHQMMWLIQNNELGKGDLYPCLESAFNMAPGGTFKRIA